MSQKLSVHQVVTPCCVTTSIWGVDDSRIIIIEREKNMIHEKDYEYDYSHDPDERYVGDEDEAGDEPDTSEMDTATSW
jgi:hypothetical protein